MGSLKGKVALVTGASKGIGAGIAKELAARGAAVAVNYSSSKAEAENVVREIEKAGGKAIAVKGSVADPAQIAALVEEAAKLGPIDVLVNNAGIYEFGPIDAVTPEHFKKQFDVNVLGLLLVTQAALKKWNPAGGGSVVNISSVVVDGVPGAAVYSATKGAVDAITASLAKELGARGIRVNSLNPGMVETEGTHAAGFIGSDFQKDAVSRTPLGRIGQPKDIATAAAFLASDDSAWINGQAIHAAGGFRL